MPDELPTYDPADVKALVEALNRYRRALRAGMVPLGEGSFDTFRAAADQTAAAYEDVMAAHIKLGGIAPIPFDPPERPTDE